MFDKPQTLEVNAEDLAVIEAALHTQSKIMDVQANAGGHEARAHLNQIKAVLASLKHQKPPQAITKQRCKNGWHNLLRFFGTRDCRS